MYWCADKISGHSVAICNKTAIEPEAEREQTPRPSGHIESRRDRTPDQAFPLRSRYGESSAPRQGKRINSTPWRSTALAWVWTLRADKPGRPRWRGGLGGAIGIAQAEAPSSSKKMTWEIG